MSKLIPNARTFVGFATTLANGATTMVPKLSEVTGAQDLTGYLITLNASSQGNTVPTPDLSTLFETSTLGTTQATFTADFYIDDTNNEAWDALARGVFGYFLISRMEPNPVVGTDIEVWPIIVTSRTAGALSSNTAQTFTLTCSVPKDPIETQVAA